MSIKYIVALVLLCQGMLRAQTVLYLDTLTVNAGDTSAVGVSLENSVPVRSVQFDITPVPSNALTYLRVNKLDPVASWSAAPALHGDTLRVILYKLSSETIPPGDTKLLSLEYAVSEDSYNHSVSLNMSGVVVVDSEVKQIADVSVVDGVLVIEGSGGLPGDIDGNGKTDIFDLLDVLQIISGKQTDSLGAADINRDGQTNIFDVLDLLRNLSGRG